MAKQPKYIALVGIDFENVKPPVRVEAGKPIPDRVVAASRVQDLIEQGLIKESEGDK